MVKFLSQHSKWIIAGFGFLVFGLTETDWLTSSELWQKAEGALIDRRYLLRGESPPDSDIILVGLGTSAFQLDALSTNEIAASPVLQLMQQPWPWDRQVYAAVLEKLMSGGAKVVVFDFVFAGETDGDDEFANQLLKYKDHVIIGENFADEEGAGSKTKRLTMPNSRLLLPGTESIVGLVNQWTDPDQVIRSVKYHTSLERETLGQSGLDPRVGAVLQKMVDDGEAPDSLTHITALAAKEYMEQDVAPFDDNLHFIDFQGQSGTYRPLPIEEMFVDNLWRTNFRSGLVFSNRIAVVGPMAEIFHDDHLTPFGDMPGPELQTQIMAALLRHSWLAGTSPLLDSTLALVMLGLGLGICLRIKNAIWKVLLLAASVAVYFVVCQIAFTHTRLVLPMTQPLCCLAVPGAFGVVFQYALEQFERIRTRGLLERYVSKNVAKTILEDQTSFLGSLSGRKQAVTILFSDIRGFTSMTESSDAEKLVAQLNEYFAEMVDVIQEKNSGTLQKFIGDAIMAAWGDTYSSGATEDARRAVSAALQMRAALAKLNERWATQPDRLKLKIGVGVNHGEVIYGNIGTHDRMELTVLGDGVNLASRLESATKQFHTDILVGETVEALTRDQFIYRNVGAIAFKGKIKPVEVFTLLSDCSQPAPAWLAKYHDAIRLYRDRQFAVAITRFQGVAQEIGGEDFLCHMYIEQCRVCLEQSPPPDWDGSYSLTEK